MTERITVVGTGYVGLIQGVCLATSGYDVTCVDLDAEKVEMLSADQSPIHEPDLKQLLHIALTNGRLHFATPANGWTELIGDIVFVAVGTPMAVDGSCDLSAVVDAVGTIAAKADHDIILVMKSTVPPGTGTYLQDRVIVGSPYGVAYVSNPEFLREGQAIRDWYGTDRIVLGGSDVAAMDAVRQLYEDVDETTVVVTDVTSAEAIKYASNAFLATKVSFINEMANVCEAVGADIDDVARGVGLDSRIGGQFLHAGIGYGGSCFPKDIRALDFIADDNGYRFTLLKAVIEVNARQRELPVRAVCKALRDLHGARVAVLGLSFKPDTDDVRESPALDVIKGLVYEGAAVRVYDPMASDIALPFGAVRVADVDHAVSGANAVVLVTEWPEFAALDWTYIARIIDKPRVVFDGRNALDSEALRAAGIKYIGVGRR